MAVAVLLACVSVGLACAGGDRPDRPRAEPRAIGAPAPQLLLKTVSDEDLDLAAFRGRIVLLSFWATWCKPCREELPRLEELHRAFGEKGIEVIAVNFGEQQRRVRQFLKINPVLTLRVALDPKKEAGKQFGVAAIPSTVMIDWNGTIRWSKTGYDGGYRDELLGQLAALVDEYHQGAPQGEVSPSSPQ